MIPDLLWRCPLCGTNDALVQRCKVLVFRWRWGDVVECNFCQARWRVVRLAGDNFYLHLVHPSRVNPESVDSQLSLPAWYDRMKSTLKLQVMPVPVALGEELCEHENLYLASPRVTLWATEADGLNVLRCEPGPQVKSPRHQKIGQGWLFLTNKRFVWFSEKVRLESSLAEVQGVYTFLSIALCFICRGAKSGDNRKMVLRIFSFEKESPLKWLTYLGLLAPVVAADCGHAYRVSHY